MWYALAHLGRGCWVVRKVSWTMLAMARIESGVCLLISMSRWLEERDVSARLQSREACQPKVSIRLAER